MYGIDIGSKVEKIYGLASPNPLLKERAPDGCVFNNILAQRELFLIPRICPEQTIL